MDLSYKTKREDIMTDKSDSDSVIEYLNILLSELSRLKEKADEVQHYQQVFQLKVSSVDELLEVSQDLNLKVLLWNSSKKWNERVTELAPKPYINIDIEALGSELQNYTRVATQISNTLPDHPLGRSFKSSVQQYNEILPVIIALSNKKLNSSRYIKIRDLTTINFQEQNYTLQFLFDRNVSQWVEQIESISNDATNESSLLHMLHEIVSIWEKVEFTMIPHKDIKDVYLVGSLDDVIAQLEESQVQLSTI